MSIREIKGRGRNIMRAQWGDLLVVLIIQEVILAIANVLSLGIAGVLISGPLACGVTYIYFTAYVGDNIQYGDMFKYFKANFGEIVLASFLKKIISMVLTFAIFIVGILELISNALQYSYISPYSYGYYYNPLFNIFGGSFFGAIIRLVISLAAIYVLLSLTMLTYILMREQGIKATSAIKLSWEMMKGNKIRVILFNLSFIGWLLLTIITFGILSIWTAPYYSSSKLALLEDIYGNYYRAQEPINYDEQ